jgi:hypothetical protein
MLRGLNRCKIALYLLVVGVLGAVSLGKAQHSVSVDATAPREAIDRAVFGFVNYQSLYALGDSKAREQFLQLKPAGSQVRIEATLGAALRQPESGDPADFDWDRHFNPSSAFVTVDDARRFLQEVRALGIEPVLLVTYNVPWLAKDGRPTGAPIDNSVWVEFVLRLLDYLSAVAPPGEPPVRYLEVWNEPNITQFWTGTRDEYFELFNMVADAVHERFPGVLVGGPTLSPTGGWGGWLRAFIAACGDRADFVSWHSYGQVVDRLVYDIVAYGELFAQETGKSGPRVMITETDSLMAPDDKFVYLIERQLALAELAEHLLGVHHFSLPRYQEGAYLFGLIDYDGTLVAANYWPYWALRDFRGYRLDAALSGELMAHQARVAAAVSEEGQTVSVVLLNPGRGEAEMLRDVGFDLILPPAETERVANLFVVSAAGADLIRSDVLPAEQTDYRVSVDLPAFAAAVLTVNDAAVQPGVWAEIRVDKQEMIVGDRFEATLTVHNITSRPISGSVFLVGAPGDWEITSDMLSSFEGLMPGETFRYQATVHASSRTPLGGSAVYTFVNYREPGARSVRASSPAIKIEALAPLVFDVLPPQLYLAPGQTQEVRLTATNTFNRAIAGELRVELPSGWPAVAPSPYALAMGEQQIFTVALTAPVDAAEGDYPVEVGFTYEGTFFGSELPLKVRDYPLERTSVPLLLDALFDSDLFTAEDDFTDVSNFGGPFSYPAKFFPSNEWVNFFGVDFFWPDTSTGALNGVHAEGQRLAVPVGRYQALYFLSAATNGDKRVEFTFHYEDGTSDTATAQITDWCVDAKYGEIEIIRAPYRHNPTGILRDCESRVMLESLPVDAGKALAAITLPERRDFWLIALSLVE